MWWRGSFARVRAFPPRFLRSNMKADFKTNLWWSVVAVAGVAAALVAMVRAEPEKNAAVKAVAETAPAPGLELPKESLQFVLVAAARNETNEIWGRPIPGRVSLQTAARVNLGALVDGRVEEVLVRPGDQVVAGAPLLKILSASGGISRAEEEAAAAHLAAAEENLRRYTAMLAKGVGTELELFEAETKLREARIDADRTRKANALLGSGKGPEIIVTAPTNGLVLSVSATTGTALQPGNEVVELGDPARIWVEAEISEDEATQISRGQFALLDAPRLGKNARAKVESITGVIDPTTRRRRVYLTPEGKAPGWLTPGMYVEARLSESSDQLLLPAEAVLIKEGEHRVVYVQKDDGKFYPREVLVNPSFAGRVRVLKGLEPGEKVVMKGALLVDGRSEQLL